MHLKRVELFGFKSFADRTVLGFDGSLTGIVGPNGCGKSNVVDAIRWVLGEQRPTSMRGADMKDVIFKGSASRPAMTVAETTLVLDNQDGTIEERAAEVAITRRVYASGEGEYLIDGERVRLKDVRTMLYDTGLGSRGYSVLEQGRIDAVLSANPLDRRAIFEEAAGISRYRQQRSEVESRLRRVAQDLERLDDVLAELRTRERSLKIQAGRAERYVQARDAWLSGGKELCLHQLVVLERELVAGREQAGALSANADGLRARRETAEGEVVAREQEQAVLASELERKTAEAAEVSGDLRALDERSDLLGKRAAALEVSAGDEERRAAELAAKLAERRAELAALETRASELAAEEAGSRQALEESTVALRAAERRLREARQASAAQNETVLGCLHAKTAAKNRCEHLEHSLAPLAERARRAGARLDDARRTLSAAQAAAESALAELAEAEGAATVAAAQRGAVAEREGAVAERLAALVERRADLAAQQSGARSRIESLRDWEREREGLEAGAQSLLAGADEAAGPLAPDELRGILADHLRVPSDLARALDAVLGSRAQALVLGDAERALAALEWLKAGRRGLARFVLPLSDAPRSAELAAELARAAADPLALGPLRARVSAAPGFEALCDFLLAGVLLVRDARSAAVLAARHPTLVCITPEGDRADATGIAGGHREIAQGPVGRRSRADEEELRLVALEAELAALAAQAETLEAERRECAAARARADLALEERRSELAGARAAEEGARARLADLTDSARLFEAESGSVLGEEARLCAELEQARAALVAAEQGFEHENARYAEVETSRHELEAGAGRLSKEEVDQRVAWTAKREQRDGLLRRLDDLRRGCDEAEAESERTLLLSRTHAAEARAGRAESEALAARRVELLEARGALEVALGELREHERALRAVVERGRRGAEAITRELEGLQELLAGARLDVQRLELALDELVRRAREDFGLDVLGELDRFEPRSELLAPEALAHKAADVAEKKRELERLGTVNLDAVTELEEVSGRLGFLDRQRADLVDSRETLTTTLARIDEESARLFLETFAEVRDHFRVIFRRLFGGGRADVTLAEGLPPLEAGIEISARPPGREMLPLGLLSGGQRTLTALALLFAVFRSRPSPFCVLDEVDAALDDANIGRFLGMLEDFRANTQFVLVTHNKGSMAACDLLYGITMQVRGVSHVVSVELDQVDEFLPDANGTAPARAPEPEVRVHANGGGSEEGSEPIVELVPEPARPVFSAPELEGAPATVREDEEYAPAG